MQTQLVRPKYVFEKVYYVSVSYQWRTELKPETKLLGQTIFDKKTESLPFSNLQDRDMYLTDNVRFYYKCL